MKHSSICTTVPEKFTGIIQLTFLDKTKLLEFQKQVIEQHSDQKPNPKLHVTLLHQAFLKKVTNSAGLRGDKALKMLYKNGGHLGIPTPPIQLGDVKMGFNLENGRRSSYAVVKNPEACLEVRNALLEAADIDPSTLLLSEAEESRVFHVSLTNLEGNSGASIAYPQPNDKNVEII